jgi:protein-tyrosine-phosphatase
MAEGLLRRDAEERFNVESAGIWLIATPGD